MVPAEIRKVNLIPIESRTDEEKKYYKIYLSARETTTGSLMDLRNKLDMDEVDFYLELESNVFFREAILQGFDDSRRMRLLELEASLIKLALGSVVEDVTITESEEEYKKVTSIKHIQPNLTALQVLLEKYEGSSWTVTQRVDLNAGELDKREVPYNMLTKKQLKALAESGEE